MEGLTCEVWRKARWLVSEVIVSTLFFHKGNLNSGRVSNVLSVILY